MSSGSYNNNIHTFFGSGTDVWINDGVGNTHDVTTFSGNGNVTFYIGTLGGPLVTNNTHDTAIFGDGDVTMVYVSGGVGNAYDNIFAGNGNDTLIPAPKSRVVAGNGNDTIYASPKDTIKLGNGTDTIFAGADNSVTLGTGVNTILYGVASFQSQPIGQEVVKNFNPAIDQIVINHTLVKSFNVQQVGPDTVTQSTRPTQSRW
jgi:hypothetical protein